MLLLLTTAAAKKGTEYLCLGPRAHTITYDISGETLEEIENATISVQPDYSSSCNSAKSHHGDKTMCIGANVDRTCTAASKDIPFNSYLDCASCFAGLTTDLFYTLEVKAFALEQVEVGLRNSHLRGAAEVHGHADKAVTLPQHKVTLIGDKTLFKASFMVAGVVPVHIEVAVPTTFNYDLGFKGSIDATVGADLDINIGDHHIKYHKHDGFSHVNDEPSYTFTPKLNVDVEAEADITLGVESKVAISVDKVISYDVRMQPSFPLKVDLENNDKNICIGGAADFVLSHEADLHFKLFGKNHDLKHYGPKQLFHYHKDDVFKKCIDIQARESKSTVVV